ncbi:thiamine pyrophosphate-dependent enzyme [Candidatus Omnitrophota bacterium]
MKRIDVIACFLSCLNDDDIAFFTTGMISREAFTTKDRKANFYMIGSMGLIASVGLGSALNTKKRVFVFDGDGSVLMDMGAMATIASCKPRNFIHIILDNESYQSTGGQSSASACVDLDNVARAIGYENCCRLNEEDIASGGIRQIIQKTGPMCIVIKVDKESNTAIGRISIDPKHVKERISEALKEQTSYVSKKN